MASAATLTAFEAKIDTWSNISSCPRKAINDLAASPASAWLEVESTISTEDRGEMGPPPVTYREIGVIRLTPWVRNLAGVSQALTWADELRDLLRDTEFSDVVTYEIGPPTFDEKNRRGVFYGAPILVPYQRDYIKG